MYHTFRLEKDDDLKRKIEAYAQEEGIKAGVVICCVGCLSEANIRVANGIDELRKVQAYEIVSMTGTVSINGSHIHIALSDDNGLTIGGHLKEGCIVNTTAEICILELPSYKFERIYDANTGYKELNIEKL